MVSRENAIIGGCLLVAFVVGFAISEYTTAPSWVAIAAFLLVGLVVPVAANEYRRRA